VGDTFWFGGGGLVDGLVFLVFLVYVVCLWYRFCVFVIGGVLVFCGVWECDGVGLVWGVL